jgi:hypothetical protein
MLGTGARVRLIGVDTPKPNQPDRPVEYFGTGATDVGLSAADSVQQAGKSSTR